LKNTYHPATNAPTATVLLIPTAVSIIICILTGKQENIMTDQECYNELAFYTLAHKGENFIHQHIVDAYTAQTANDTTKPISIFFALAGLYLCVEKSYTGKQVQQAHMQMAKKKKEYPSIILPQSRGNITVSDVINIPPGPGRDEMIQQWCLSVWSAFANQQEKIILATERLLTN
jgi:Family of unknown function (DUF5946)